MLLLQLTFVIASNLLFAIQLLCCLVFDVINGL
jgi:hypothetical protein